MLRRGVSRGKGSWSTFDSVMSPFAMWNCRGGAWWSCRQCYGEISKRREGGGHGRRCTGYIARRQTWQAGREREPPDMKPRRWTREDGERQEGNPGTGTKVQGMSHTNTQTRRGAFRCHEPAQERRRTKLLFFFSLLFSLSELRPLLSPLRLVGFCNAAIPERSCFLFPLSPHTCFIFLHPHRTNFFANPFFLNTPSVFRMRRAQIL